MKTLAELAAIKEKMQSKVCIRRGEGPTKIIVGMATCGIAAGHQRARARRQCNRNADGMYRLVRKRACR